MSLSPAFFQVNPSSGVPIFRQIIDQVKAFVAAGKLRSGDMLPSTRDVAKFLEVNMMTVSKAYSRLESDGVAERVRGLGMRIREVPISGAVAERKQTFKEVVSPAIHHARQLGLTDEQVLAVVSKILKDNVS
jgi:GntR family transcriptional regulator